MRLYIYDGFCDDFGRLKEYVRLLDDKFIREDLLDAARSGDLSLWLNEHSHTKIAEEVNLLNLNTSIGDAEYISKLSALFEIEHIYNKIPYENCLKFEDVYTAVERDKFLIHVRFQIIDDVNEKYTISAISRMGNLTGDINPSQHEIGDYFEVVLTHNDYNEYIEYNYKIFIDDFELKMVHFGNSNNRFNPLNMIKVEGGNFQMGATEEQGSDASKNEVKKDVAIQEFFISSVPVTNHFWDSIMDKEEKILSPVNGGRFKPKTNITYEDCLLFIEKLNRITGETYRLPSEEEWEYAARGGVKSKHYKYSGGNIITDVAWCRGVEKYVTLHEVALKKPNELGLYDMSGNIWEWTCSPCTDFSKEKLDVTKSHRVTRGGCANSTDKGCRVSRRYSSATNHKSKFLGFRLAK